MDTKQKILNLYNNEYSNKKDRKIINLLKLVLVDDVEDISILEKLTPITKNTIKKYIQDENYILNFLTKEEYQLLIKKIEYSFKLEKQKEEIKELYLIGKIIDDVFNTRHKIEDICLNNFFTISKFRKIIDDENFIDNNFGVGMMSKLKTQIEQTALIRRSIPKNEVLIEDRFHLFVAKENIYCLNQIDYKKLKIASDYLCSGADLDFVQKKHEISDAAVLSILSDLKLKEILKESAYKNLVRYIEIDKCLLNNEIAKKQHILKSIVESLYENNFSFEKTMNYFDLPKPLFNKLLRAILKISIFDVDIKESIKQNISEENEEKKVK